MPLHGDCLSCMRARSAIESRWMGGDALCSLGGFTPIIADWHACHAGYVYRILPSKHSDRYHIPLLIEVQGPSQSVQVNDVKKKSSKLSKLGPLQRCNGSENEDRSW